MEELSPEDLRAIESQLGCPSGAKGIEMAELMHETNFGMTKCAIDALALKSNEQVLELGHGNCAHLPYLLGKAEALVYTGLEISETMSSEAQQKNQGYAEAKKATFSLYNGTDIPFEGNTFHRVFTVNTLYFWAEPAKLLNEIHRVMKPTGILTIVFAKKSFMKNLPFVGDKFTLYSPEDLNQLVATSAFNSVDITEHTEQVKSKSGELVERQFCLAKLIKT